MHSENVLHDVDLADLVRGSEGDVALKQSSLGHTYSPTGMSAEKDLPSDTVVGAVSARTAPMTSPCGVPQQGDPRTKTATSSLPWTWPRDPAALRAVLVTLLGAVTQVGVRVVGRGWWQGGRPSGRCWWPFWGP